MLSSPLQDCHTLISLLLYHPAFFLDYLSTSLSLPLLVPTLNSALRSRTWEDGALLKEVLGGKDVDELWREYKEMLENIEAVGTMTEEAVPVPTHS